jgi:phage/plasmid-like protein (TIGR03299 family)
MSHYFESGYVVRQPAWHGLAEVHEDYPQNWDQARQWAGLTWDPVAEPIWARRLTDPELLDGITAVLADAPAGERAQRMLDLFNGALQEVQGHQRVYKSDDYAATLGTPTTDYVPITHGEYGEIMEAVLKQPNVKYETAGSVQGGKCTWALALLDEPIKVGHDSSLTLPFMTLTARHDGTGAVRLQSTSVRVVCANTVHAAEVEADRNGTVFAFQHSANWRDRLEEAEQAVKGVRSDIAAYKEWADAMLGITISAEQEERFLVEFIPMPPDSLHSDRVAKNVEQARHAVRLFLASPTVEGAGIRGTGYGLMCAAVEYLDWGRKAQSRATRFTRQLLYTDTVKTQASELIREIANA